MLLNSIDLAFAKSSSACPLLSVDTFASLIQSFNTADQTDRGDIPDSDALSWITQNAPRFDCPSCNPNLNDDLFVLTTSRCLYSTDAVLVSKPKSVYSLVEPHSREDRPNS